VKNIKELDAVLTRVTSYLISPLLSTTTKLNNTYKLPLSQLQGTPFQE